MINVGIYGKVNAGKSTLFNLLTGQDLSIVSDVAGTTTDVVKRTSEVPNLGAVTFIDTAGFGDQTKLAKQRIEKTLQTLEVIDLALVITDEDKRDDFLLHFADIPTIFINKTQNWDKSEILDQIAQAIPKSSLVENKFYGDLLKKDQVVVLVCPIDNGAPVGRLILPQVQALRAALNLNAVGVVVQVEQLEQMLARLNPDLVVTDSQVFDVVTKIVDKYNNKEVKDITLTSFSILLASNKGDMQTYKEGLCALDSLKVGDEVLIIEYCSHHPSCDDIGHVKIPNLLQQFVGGELNFTFVTGKNQLPDNISIYKLAIHCGGCMTNRKQIINRITKLKIAKVPITNYGLLLRRLLTFKKS